jgi:hypothetical protein
MGDRWGLAGPPEEAYGRVTNPERFAPLHAIARELLDDLRQRFDVTADASSELDPNGTTQAPVTRLVPASERCSPLAVTFTAFPGLIVRAGPRVRFVIPPCGCDACDETLDDAVRELHECMDAITSGRVGERIVRRDGAWWHQTWHRTETGSASGSTHLADDEVDALRQKLGSDDVTWEPWQLRSGG